MKHPIGPRQDPIVVCRNEQRTALWGRRSQHAHHLVGVAFVLVRRRFIGNQEPRHTDH